MFSVRGEDRLKVIHYTEQDGCCRPVFLCLVTIDFFQYNKPIREWFPFRKKIANWRAPSMLISVFQL